MPVKHQALVDSESESDLEPNSKRSNGGKTFSTSNSDNTNTSLENKSSSGNGDVQGTKDTLPNKESQKNRQSHLNGSSDTKWASYLYGETKEDNESGTSSMLYRTDSNEDLADEEAEEQGLLGYFQNCFHPKIRKHWKTFLASVALLIAGIAFLSAATVIVFTPATEDGSELHSYVFFICGLICLIPGVYYVIYICRAAKGEKGYKMENIPTFSD